MAFKMKGSPMKRNFGIGASPAKFKLKYPAEEYTKRGFNPNLFYVRNGAVYHEQRGRTTLMHDPKHPSGFGNRKSYDRFLFKLGEIEGKIAKSMEKAKARDQKVDDSEGDRQNF